MSVKDHLPEKNALLVNRNWKLEQLYIEKKI